MRDQRECRNCKCWLWAQDPRWFCHDCWRLIIINIVTSLIALVGGWLAGR